MPIRTRLLLLVLAILLPALLAAALGIGYVYRGARDTNLKTLQETSRALALSLDSDLGRRENVLQSLAASPTLDQGDLQAFYRHAKRTAISQDVSIALSSPDGKVLLDTTVPFGALDIPGAAALENLRRQHGPEDTLISSLYPSPHDQTLSFAIQVPVKRDGHLLYHLAMRSGVKQIQAILHAQQLPPNWLAVIADSNSTVAARTLEPEKYVGMSSRPTWTEGAKGKQEGVFKGVTREGVPVTVSFSRAPRSNWLFYVNVPRKEMQRSALEAIVFMLSVSLMLLGLALAGSLVIARKTARPIEALRRAAEKLGQAQPVRPAVSGIRELDAVMDAMSHASADIRSAKATLEQRVEEAVARAERSQLALLQSQKLESLGRLTGGIAHDFNNVLQTLTSGLQLAHLSTSETKVQSLVETCQRAVERAAELTRKLMAFGRVQDARLETVDLAHQFRETVPLLNSGLPSNIDFRLTVSDSLWPVTMDRLQFELALLNLTINARDAMPDGGILRLEAHNERGAEPDDQLPKGDYVRITLSDTGTGMSQEVLSRALDPFFTTKAVGQGSGLGLPQAYGFARQAGGTLSIRSQPGKGTETILYLPRAESATGAGPGKSASAPSRSAGMEGKAVLFVEDDPLVTQVMKPALEASGFQVLQASNGDEALQILDSGVHVDFVFSDIVMPGRMSGIDLAEVVQQRHPHIRMVLATGYSDRRVALPNIRTLAKPYGLDEVIGALNGA